MKGPAMALAVVLATAAAHAQGIDLSKGGPINVTAQSGIEWLQNQHQVIATGDARAVRGNVTVIADRLIAFYRPKKGAAQQTSAPQPIATSDEETGGNEIYRLEAESNVKILTPTDMAQADKAVYDLDQAVLVLTGNNLKLTTPNDVLTARDDLEYWSLRRMAVARGDAVIITKDDRRIQADTLVAYTTPTSSTNQPQATTTSTNSNDDLASQSGKLEKAEAFGHVLLRTQTDIVTGDRGVYVPETGMAVLLGNVRITRGQNQLAGAEAIVNMKTGVSRLVSGNAGRVSGLIVPNDSTNNAIATQPATSHPATRKTHQ